VTDGRGLPLAVHVTAGQRHRGHPSKFEIDAYRRRSVIECCVGWLKECRAVATRFEKLAVNYLAMVKLAIIQRYLRRLDSSDRTYPPSVK
jgi:hypothetical protein